MSILGNDKFEYDVSVVEVFVNAEKFRNYMLEPESSENSPTETELNEIMCLTYNLKVSLEKLENAILRKKGIDIDA